MALKSGNEVKVSVKGMIVAFKRQAETVGGQVSRNLASAHGFAEIV